MKYNQLGNSGLRVSSLCLGTMVGFNSADTGEAKRIIDEAIDSGVNFIDTADCYRESEETVGAALKDNNKRDEVVLATKFGWFMGGANGYGANRKHLLKSCENSLRRLKTDYIDLYILHVVDPNTPLEELLYSLDLLVRKGYVRYTGTSKHPVSRIVESIFTSEKYGLPKFVSEQPPYNLLDRTAENELIPVCKKLGVGITPFFPLAEGLLSGHYRLEGGSGQGRLSRRVVDRNQIYTTEALKAVERLIPIAEEKGITMAEMALAWVMGQDGVSSAVLGARKPEYLRSAVKACSVVFTEEETAKIDEISPPGTFISNFFEPNVYRPLRLGYADSARKVKGTGAFIPATESVQDDIPGRRIR